ncbi:M15 family metallopeptidase, partial [Pseudomonadales bacterium]|nr:M15 family metallopeptidase [Pseudomonadales bacterium]
QRYSNFQCLNSVTCTFLLGVFIGLISGDNDTMTRENYRHTLLKQLLPLGFTSAFLDDCKMPLQIEAEKLVSAGPDVFDREQLMHPDTLIAWQEMKTVSAIDNIQLQLVSAFRSVEYQCALIQRKLDKGIDLAEILTVNAAPGFSEHHTGKALDLTTVGEEPLEESFETTDAFSWLQTNASDYGFSLSYPRDNPWGIAYEPWHWAWEPSSR